MPPKIIGNHIQKMDRQFPLTSKFQLTTLLQEWLLTPRATIGDLYGRRSNPEPWIWIKIDNYLFKIHADTTREGIKVFVKNHEENNSLKIIQNNRGVYKKVSNDINGKAIKGLYFYSEEIGQREI